MASWNGSVVAITSTATVALSTTITAEQSGAVRLRIQMTSGTAYLGSSDVTTAGFRFSTADSPFEVTLRSYHTPLYAISSQAVALSVLKVQDF